MKYIQNEYEINMGDSTQLISDKYKFALNLVKKKNFINLGFLGEFLDNLFEYRCCGCSSKDKGNYDVFSNSINNSNNVDKKLSNGREDNNKDRITNEKMKYYEKFKDFDSYNDYVINMDNSEFVISQNNENIKI